MLVKEIIKDNVDIYQSERFIENPVVSIILPTYNRAKSGSLKRALDSFLAQSYKEFELIIVDDASIDGSFNICKEYMEKDNRIKIIRHRKNVGLPAISTYEAYIESKGQYISFGFDDNTWEEDALEKTLLFYKENDVKAGYGITKIKDPNTGDFVYIGKDSEYINDTLCYGNAVGEGSVILHRDVLETIGLFDPHISLTRICDWELWRRLIDKFDFVSTGIEFATEYGVTMSDSLGNTRPLHNWFWAEYEQNRRGLEKLLPKNYSDIDIFDCHSGSVTQYYAKKMIEGSEYYKNKFWYKPLEKDACNIDKTKKRVLVLSFSSLSASQMSFTEYSGEEFVFRYMFYGALDFASLLLTDIVVQVRGLPENNWVTKCCNALNIPIYYYTDDNFREILKNKKDSLEYINTNQEYLSDYDGIIVSSQKLVEYYENNNLHDNIIYLPPILTNKVVANNQDNHSYTIGFMGGKFREDILIQTVIPAILKLSYKYDITLVVPDDKELKNALANIKSFNVEWYTRSLNYIRALESVNEHGIDLLIHPGINHVNNRYKTKNCLGNAVLLGANLITSNIEPYNIEDELSGCYAIAENTASSWFYEIEKFILDNNYAETQKNKAQDIVSKVYSTEIGWAKLTEEWLSYPNNIDYLDRGEKILSFINTYSTRTFFHTGKTINPSAITYQPIMKKRCYRFTPNTERFDKVVLAFGKGEGCQGKALIHICNLKNELLASTTIKVDEMVRDGLTTCTLDKKIATLGEDLVISFEAFYENSIAKFGVFEVIPQRTFLYKCFNKIGKPLKGRNVIWIDVM